MYEARGRLPAALPSATSVGARVVPQARALLREAAIPAKEGSNAMAWWLEEVDARPEGLLTIPLDGPDA
eukprot:6089650-Alexandrium_andersonii.AAC.1